MRGMWYVLRFAVSPIQRFWSAGVVASSPCCGLLSLDVGVFCRERRNKGWNNCSRQHARKRTMETKEGTKEGTIVHCEEGKKGQREGRQRWPAARICVIFSHGEKLV